MNQNNFLSLIMVEIAVNGIDGLTISRISERLKISRPTIYSKYGDVEGIMADAWIEAADLDCLEVFTKQSFEVSVFFQSLSKLIAASRRFPQVYEVVQPAFAAWWNQKTSEYDPGVLSWQVANRLGVLLTSSIERDIVIALQLEPLITENINNREIPEITEIDPIILDDITLSDNLLDATLSVIANEGYVGTSMTRIARTLKVTTGALYPLFTNATQLVEKVFADAQKKVVESNTLLWHKHGLDQDSFGLFINSGLYKNRERWRHLRLETLLAGPNFSNLGFLTRDALKTMAQDLQPIMEQANFPNQLRLPISYFAHTLAVGLGVLMDLKIPVDQFNHVVTTKKIALTLAKMEEERSGRNAI
jgi:AcrR family transcriptional regulator